jgi:two-component system, cell cycle sensor histidine kinase and response regulator CckA
MYPLNNGTMCRQAERALIVNEKRFHSLLQSIPSVAVQGYGPDGTTQYWNQASERRYGYSAQEAIGRNLMDLIIPPEMRADAAQAVRQMIDNGQPIPALELSLMRKDGARVAVFSSHAVVQIPGSAPEIFSMEIDLTEHKRAQAEKARLDILNRHLQKSESLGRMAGSIAHHFNNQLQVVMGNLEMAVDGLQLGNNPFENLISATQAARKIAEVIGLLLTYLGQTPVKHEPIDLSEACRQTLPLIQATVPNGRLVMADFPCSGPVICSNPAQIQHVLTNLITNAWESADKNRGCFHLAVKRFLPPTSPPLPVFP